MKKANFILPILLFTAFIFRVINLNYNTPFNDEAIYVVIGRMGLFQHDWWSYNARSWMAGLPFFYPPLSALAYQFWGIISARLLNVIFGILALEQVYRLTLNLDLFDSKTNKMAAWFAVVIAGFSSLGLYVSRLATHDMLSFLFLFLAINSLLKAYKGNDGKKYFIASMGMAFAFATKIVVAVFILPLFIMSFLKTRKSRRHFSRWLHYFSIPFALAIILYLLYNFDGLVTFIRFQRQGEQASVPVLVGLVWDYIGDLLLLLALSALLLAWRKKLNQVLFWLVLALVIPAMHLSQERFSTFDKHLYLTVLFAAPIIGYGLVTFQKYYRFFHLYLRRLVVGALLLSYAVFSQPNLTILETAWPNTARLNKFLIENVKPQDRILTENGASIILALQEVVPPSSITTFDWIDYAGKQNEEGYFQAITDEYYDFIELDGGHATRINLSRQIEEKLSQNYKIAYTDNDFIVYKKNEEN